MLALSATLTSLSSATGQRQHQYFLNSTRKHIEHICIARIDCAVKLGLTRLNISGTNLNCKELHFGTTNCPQELRGFLLSQGLCKPGIKLNGQAQLAKAIAYDMFYAATGRPVPFNHASLCDGISRVLSEEETFLSVIELDTHACLTRLFTGFREYVGKAELHAVGQQDDKRVLVNRKCKLTRCVPLTNTLSKPRPLAGVKPLLGDPAATYRSLPPLVIVTPVITNFLGVSSPCQSMLTAHSLL